MQVLLSALDVETLLWWGGEGYAGEGVEAFAWETCYGHGGCADGGIYQCVMIEVLWKGEGVTVP